MRRLFSVCIAIAAGAASTPLVAESINDFNEEARLTQQAIEAASQGVIHEKFKGVLKESDFDIGKRTEEGLADYALDKDILDAAVKPKDRMARRFVEEPSLGDEKDLGTLASMLADSNDDAPSSSIEEVEYEGSREPKVLMFISSSMDEELLKDAFLTANASNEKTPTVMLLRGLVPGMRNIHRVMWHFYDIAQKAGLETPPSIYIDPESFTKYNVQQVPMMIHRDFFLKDEIARLAGSVNIPYLAEQVGYGKSGDLGRLGDVYEIAERNLIDEMKERTENIDWAEKKSKAADNFWHSRVEFFEFPTAREDTERLVNPTVEITEDMRLPDGRIIAKKGSRYNPLAIVPFNREVYIFNATSPAQLRKAIELKTASQTKKLQVFITTQSDRSGGFEWLAALEEKVGAPVYILNKDLASNFRIENIPAVVTDHGELLKINEYAVNALEGEVDD